MILSNNELNRLFDEILGANSNLNWKTTVVSQKDNEQSYEVNQTEDGAYLFFDAPGFNKTNLKAELENGVLHIEGKRTYKINGKEKTKTISKEFNIGENYNPSLIEATIEDGLLTVFVPNYKKQEKTRINIL